MDECNLLFVMIGDRPHAVDDCPQSLKPLFSAHNASFIVAFAIVTVANLGGEDRSHYCIAFQL